MGYFTDTYEDLRKNLLDYTKKQEAGQNVGNVPLSLANRAQNNLWAKKPWCDLLVDVSVVLVNGSYSFPTNYGRLVQMGADLDGDGCADYWYFQSNQPEYGYKMRDSFSKTTGHVWAITFNYPQQSNIVMTYQKLLDAFTGEGTEYLFFPLNLMLLECQKILKRERGNIQESAAIEVAEDIEFKDYCNAHQWLNYDPRSLLIDSHQNQISVESYSLSGDTQSRHFSIYPNSKLP